MHSTAASKGMAGSLLLFGPQLPRIIPALISEVRLEIVENAQLSFLTSIINELPSVYSAIQQECPALQQLPGTHALTQLRDFFETGRLPQMEAPNNNIILAPLTVITHLVEYLRLPHQVGDVQGFCVGLLAATAVACSQNRNQLEQLAGTAIRLALLVGAAIDLDETIAGGFSAYSVEWRTQPQMDILETTLLTASPQAYTSCVTDVSRRTVTMPKKDYPRFSRDMTQAGLVVKPVGLSGRYHHPGHREIVDQLKSVCRKIPGLQFPTAADELQFPLRSTIDARPIERGFLHEIALECILSEKCHWYETVHNAVQASGPNRLDIVSIGGAGAVPASLGPESHGLLNGVGSQASHTNGVANGHVAHSTGAGVDTTLNSLPPSPSTSAMPVAVIGIACRYPQAPSIEEFWTLINSGKTAVGPLPTTRFDPKTLWREPKDKPFWGNFLDDPDAFDHRFFKISSREAESMDPQQRLLLQVAYEAIESAGYGSSKARQQTDRVGCYVGVGSVDYEANVASHPATAFSATGTLRAFISGKVSHHFGWTGPSVTFDTACSSSAVAIHYACKALQTNECSMALAAGVNVITAPSLYQNLAAASFLSPTGASKAFDDAGDGYCRGEGAGVLVLKPLAQAIADGDPILGTIVGSAVNQGSNCSPITVPDSESQSVLYKQALASGGISPHKVSYVEAHGTGTPVGDPIECESIRRTFTGTERTQELLIGSVKDVIGHTEAASGVAGCLKVLLMMRNGVIPKQPNFTRLNRKILSLAPDNMAIASAARPWEVAQRTALVNNYGAAGSNVAIILQEYAASSRPGSTSQKTSVPPAATLEYPIILAAKTPESLQAYSARLKGFLQRTSTDGNAPTVADVAYNLARKQNPEFPCFATSTVGSIAGLVDWLGSMQPRSRPDPQQPVILCFGGQTGRSVHLSRDVVESCGLLKKHLMDCSAACLSLGLPAIFPRIFDATPMDDLVTLHALLFSVQYATAKAWLDAGLEVGTLVGHSFGQLTALCVADSIDLFAAIRLVTERAMLIQKLWGSDPGAMLAVEGDTQQIQPVLGKLRTLSPACNVDVACYNGPRSIVLAGGTPSINTAENVLRQSPGLKVTRLNNSHAYHSNLADPILPGLREVAESISWRPPRIPVETCSRGQAWSKVTATEVVEHTRQPVYFADAIQRIAHRFPSGCLWLEAGSASPIISLARKALPASRDDTFLPTDLGSARASYELARITSSLWAAGSRVTSWPFHHTQKSQYQWVDLPPYQFAKTKHWLEYKPGIQETQPVQSPVKTTTELVQLVSSQNGQAVVAVNVSHDTYIQAVSGHAVLGQSLCPASMYFELAIRAAEIVPGNGSRDGSQVPQIVDLDILSPLALRPAGPLLLSLSVGQGQNVWDFALYTQTASITKHATGQVAFLDEHTVLPRLHSLRRLLGPSRHEQIANSPHANRLSGDVVYKVFKRAVDYAPYYRGVRNVVASAGEVYGDVLLPSPRPNDLPQGVSDPVLVDNILQVAGIHVNCLSECKEEEVFVCTGIKEIVWTTAFMGESTQGSVLRVYSNFEPTERNSVVNDILVLDPVSGEAALLLLGVRFTAVALASLHRALSKLNGAAPPPPPPLSVSPVAAPRPLKLESAKDVVGAVVRPRDETLALKAQMTSTSNTLGVLAETQQMLGEILGVPVEEILADSSLLDLGVDSLMITEVCSEINKRFAVAVTVSDLQDLTDVGSLSRHLAGLVGDNSPAPTTPTATTSSISSGEFIDDGISIIGGNWLSLYRDTYDTVVKEAGLSAFREVVYPLQARLVVAYVVEALAAQGYRLDTMNPGETLDQFSFLPKHTKVVKQIHRMLEEAGLFAANNGGISRTGVPLVDTAAHQLHAEITERFPQHVAEHELLRTTGSCLSDCLTGKADPLSLLFRDANSKRLLEEVYTNAPMFKAGTLFLARFLIDLLQRFGGQREIRILELGAGTGGTTRFLVEQLVATQQRFEYTFTDLSPSLVAAAKKKFPAARYPFMRYATLDIEKPVSPDLLQQYDIVISTNCIHATRDLVRSCSHIRHMLRPDGILCLLELTQNLYWFDLVFGLLEGWWLFEDGRTHALASEALWEQTLLTAGYGWVDWSEGASEESKILRLIVASPSAEGAPAPRRLLPPPVDEPLAVQETVTFKHEGALALQADVFYPPDLQTDNPVRPVALMIHGGGHVMLSRKDIRPHQTKTLLNMGFIPVSIHYRLCPEIGLREGPMTDVRDALHWTRTVLPSLTLKRTDFRITGDQVIAVGWSTGGHLALTLGWTAPAAGIPPPQAILAFYSPTDYEDPCWTRPNRPFGEEIGSATGYDLWEGVCSAPITAYNPPPSARAGGGWMARNDARSRIALHMNWYGQTLPILLHGLDWGNQARNTGNNRGCDLPVPALEDVRSISPLAQIRRGVYSVPTFLVHPVLDDLIPWEQAQRTYQALVERGVPAHLRLVEGAVHLFDMHPRYTENGAAAGAVEDAYRFLAEHVALQ